MLVRLLPFAVIAVLAWPLTFGPPRDSFPLSSYPMFARARKTAELRLHYFVAVGPGGERSFVAPRDVASAEVLQAQAVIAHAARGGKSARDQLCAAVARRLGGRPGRAGGELRLVKGRHDAIAYLTGQDQTGIEKILARCPIPVAPP